jgi:ribonuclease I
MTDSNRWRSTGAERTDWRDHAACSGLDPELFFPVSTSGASLTEIEARLPALPDAALTG